MKKYTKETYMNHITESLGVSDQIETEIASINKVRCSTGYGELISNSPRAFNKCVDAIKYFNKLNMPYYDPNDISSLGVEQWILYIQHKQNESKQELDKLINFINEKNLKIIESKEFKRRNKIRNIYSKLTEKHPNLMYYFRNITKHMKSLDEISYKDEFKEGLQYVENYNKISDEILNLDFEKNMLDSTLFALDTGIRKNKNTIYSENELNNIKEQSRIIKNLALHLTQLLKITNHSEEEINILLLAYLEQVKKDEIELQKILISKYDNFKQTTNTEEKTLSKHKKM